MPDTGHVAINLTHTCPFLLTAPHREELVVDLQEEEEEVMEELAGLLEEEVVEEEVAGPQVEEAVEEELRDPMEELPLPEVEEKAAEEQQEVEPVVKLQVEEVPVVEEEGENPASPTLHLPSPSLATLVKAKVKIGIKEYIAGKDMTTSFLIWKSGVFFATFFPIMF